MTFANWLWLSACIIPTVAWIGQTAAEPMRWDNWLLAMLGIALSGYVIRDLRQKARAA